MKFDAAGVMALWDRGEQASAQQRARLLLELALPGRTPEELLRLSVGQHDSALTGLRRAWFGNTFEGYVECPRCTERLEVAMQLPAGEEEGGSAARFTSREGHTFRPPDVSDLDAIAVAHTTPEAVQMLLRRCCTSAPECVPDAWSTEQIAEIDAGLAALQSDAELHASFSCPSCGHAWDSALDPASFLWEELEACAIQLLHAVHRLATAYGWSERDILSLSAKRRETYLAFLES